MRSVFIIFATLIAFSSANAFWFSKTVTTLSEDASQVLCTAMEKVDDLEKKLELPIEDQNIFSTLSGKIFMPESNVVSCSKENNVYKARIDLSRGGEEVLCEALKNIDNFEERNDISLDEQTVFSIGKENFWMPESKVVICNTDGTIQVND